MRSFFDRLGPGLLAALGLAFAACSSASSDTPTTAPVEGSPAPADAETPTHAAVAPQAGADDGAAAAEDPDAEVTLAYFAGGCFWGVEHYMEELDGVLSVESGYMGGHVEDPTYQQVSSQTSGHLETVRVRFDARRIGYEKVAKRFFEIHDPTQANGQGPDIGPEYLSAVFYTDAEQKRITEGLIERLKERGFEVVTELRQADRFWPAEEYHQNYYVRKGTKPYCHAWVDRFGTGK